MPGADPDFVTLTEAQEELREHWRDPAGIHCPCCGQLVILRRRKLNSGMARALIEMLRIEEEKGQPSHWIHYSQISDRIGMAASAEYSKLADWGLIASRGDAGDRAPSAGYWQLTAKGRSFALNRITVPKYTLRYNGRSRGLDGPEISIWDALGDHFDYWELMGLMR